MSVHDSIIRYGLDPENLNRNAYSRAFAEMLSRLQQGSCAWLFGGEEEALGVLGGSWIRIANLGPAGIRSVTIAQTLGNTVKINTEGGFFTSGVVQGFPLLVGQPPPLMQINTFGLQGAEYGAFVLLHELGHLTGIFGEDSDQRINDQHSQKVVDACFK